MKLPSNNNYQLGSFKLPSKLPSYSTMMKSKNNVLPEYSQIMGSKNSALPEYTKIMGSKNSALPEYSQVMGSKKKSTSNKRFSDFFKEEEKKITSKISNITIDDIILYRSQKNFPSKKETNQKLEERDVLESKYLQNQLPTFINSSLRFYDINVSNFEEILQTQWFNSDAMLSLQYALNMFLTDSTPDNTSMLIRHYFNHLKKIGFVSVYGNVYSTKIKNTPNLVVIKTPQSPIENLSHELFIGLYGVNSLRRDIPNFVWTFGGFECSQAIDDGKNVISYCKQTNYPFDYIILENVTPNISMINFLIQNSVDDFINLYLQILYALNTANQKISFTHYDLHTKNILIKTTNQVYSVAYSTENDITEWCNTKYIAVIIDFGRSHIKHDNHNFGVYGYEKFGISGDKIYPMHDAYKLLCFCLYELANQELYDKFDYISPILQFFNKTESPYDIIDFQGGYNLPRGTIFDEMSLLNLTQFIKKQYTVTGFNKTPTGKILKFDEIYQCPAQVKYLEYLNIGNYPQDIITLRTYISGLTAGDINMQKEQLKNGYFSYKLNAVKEINYLKKQIKNLWDSVNIKNEYTQILGYTVMHDKEYLKTISRNNFIREYQKYLYTLVELSQKILDLNDFIDSMEYITQKLNIIDNYINLEKKYYTTHHQKLMVIKYSLINDRKLIPEEYLSNDNTPEHIKVFYNEKVTALYDAI